MLVITEGAKLFVNQCIVLAEDVRRSSAAPAGMRLSYSTGMDAIGLAQNAVSRSSGGDSPDLDGDGWGQEWF